LWLLVYLLCAIGVGGLAARRLLVAGGPVGLIGGGLLWLGLAYLSGIPRKMAKARQIRSALAGEPLRDGKIGAIAGRIEPLGETLVSPFTHTPCVAYSYQIRMPQSRGSAPWEYKGVAMVPCAIGSLKLLALPALDVPERFRRGDEAIRNAEGYIASAEFTVPVPFKPDDVATPRARFDHRVSNPETDLRRTMLYERVVTPGQQVCAFGRYDAALGGLAHESDSIVPTLTLMEGDGTAIQHTLARRILGNGIGGLALIALVLFALITLYVKVPLAAAEQMQPRRNTWWWEVRVDDWMQRVFDDMRREEFIPTGLAAGIAQGRIEVAGRDVRVQSASATHDGNDVRITLSDSSNVVATVIIDENAHTLTRLELLGQPIAAPAELDVIRVSSDSVEGRLTSLGKDARCRVAFNAAFTSSR